MKILTIVAILSGALIATAPADAKSCRNAQGRYIKCHEVIAPRIDINKKSPVKVVRCRGKHGRFVKCP